MPPNISPTSLSLLNSKQTLPISFQFAFHFSFLISHFSFLMPNKMKLPSLLKNSTSSSWPWPSCHQPRTLSFRAQNDAAFKTINAAYLDATSDSFFTVSPNSRSFSTASEQDSRTRETDSSFETVNRALRSDRLFFQPDETSSILESSNKVSVTETETETASLPFKDSVVMSVESQDPYVDFRRSMEEMVEAQCVKGWEGLQELLCWYLKVNGKSNHGYIVGAFVDLLVASESSLSHSPSSPLSFYSSSLSSSCSTRCVSCLEAEDQIVLDNVIPSTTPSSSFLLEQVREDEASSSSLSLN